MIEHSTKSRALWALGICSAVLSVLLLVKMSPSREPWTFVTGHSEVPITGPVGLRYDTLTPQPEKQFVHAASAIATPAGMMAFWYRAIYEGAPKGEIVKADFDGTRWSAPAQVINAGTLSRETGVQFKSLANPVPFWKSDRELWLFFSASRLSGWATCEIILIRSFDNGRTWDRPQRLYASPMFNISNLTKSVPVHMSGGRIALPAYHELGTKYPVMMVLGDDGRVVDRRHMGNPGHIGFQPSIVPTSATSAVAFVRRLNDHVPQRMRITRTTDGGETWTPVTDTELPNPGGAISAIRYDENRILLAYNDDPKVESNISLALSDLTGTHWKRVGKLAKLSRLLPTDQLMYPYLIQSKPGEFEVFFSRFLKSIEHVRVSSAWIEREIETKAAQK